MSNRPIFLLWISVHVEENPEKGKKGFRLYLPLPFFLLLMLVDMAEDIVDFICLFPGARRSLNRKMGSEDYPGMISAVAAVRVAKSIILELMLHTGPTDLVDVDAGEDGHRVRVRCILR